MKKILLLLCLTTGLFSLSAGVVKLTSPSDGLKIFDSYGQLQQTATDLDISWTAVTSDNPVSFDCIYGSFTVFENSAVTIGYDISEIYLHLLNGIIELSNKSSNLINVYTPVSKISISSGSSVRIVSTSSQEYCSLIHGTASIYDSITGETEYYQDIEISEEESVEEPEYVSVVPVVVFPQKKQETTKENLVSPAPAEIDTHEIKTTTFGNGATFGLKAHITVPKLNLNVTSEKNAQRVRNSLENTDFAVGITTSYNSLIFGFRADPVNTNPNSYKIQDSKDPALSALRLLGSFVDEVSYGSKGTLLHIKADRKTNLSFKHPLFGDMDRLFSDTEELGFLTEVKTDRVEMTCFSDNLSFRNLSGNEDLGFRFAARPFSDSNLLAGLSLLVINKTNLPLSLEYFPAFDVSFKVFESNKAKGDLSVHLTAPATDFSKFLAGASIKMTSALFSATFGVDVNNKAYMSRIVDYRLPSYKIYSQELSAPVINMYFNGQFNYNSYFASLSANIPFDFKVGEDLNPLIERGFSLQGGAKLNKTNVWTAVKYTNTRKLEKLSIGADFDFDISVLSFELGYDNKVEDPVFLTTKISLAVDTKLLSE